MAEALRAKYAIIGAGAAGIAAAEALREIDREGELTIVNREEAEPYCRPLIVELLTGERTAEQIRLRESAWFDERRIRLLTGDPAVSLDPAAKRVTLASGGTLLWEKLLIAVGAQPASPDIPGLSAVPALSLGCQEDVARLRDVCRPGARALLVGIGLIGLQALTALHRLGVAVVAIEACPRVLPLILDSTAARWVQERLEGHGIQVRVGTKLTGVGPARNAPRAYVATTDAGEQISFDFLVLAAGMRPDLGFLNGAGITRDRGIVVSESMETNVPGVYAAGDVTQYHDWIEARPEVHAHWVNAYQQGRIAGTHMAGGRAEPYAPLFMNSLRLFDLPIITMGASRLDEPAGAQVHVTQSLARTAYTRLVVRQGKLVAATFINDVERAGVFQYLMREQIDIAEVAGALLAQDRAAVEFLRKLHRERIEGQVAWPASMDLIDRYRKDHSHTRWGKRTQRAQRDAAQGAS